MKKAELAIRVLLGLLYVFAAGMFFLNLTPQPELSGPLATFMSGLMASRYLFPLAKAVELLCGIALVTGFFVPLSVIVIFPISLNIFLIHAFLAPEGLGMASFVLGATLFLVYAHWKSYTHLFVAKQS